MHDTSRDALTEARRQQSLAPDVGSSRFALHRAVDKALQRLGTDYIDLSLTYPYWHQRGFTERNPPPV